jgi:hypothetical protein
MDMEQRRRFSSSNQLSTKNSDLKERKTQSKTDQIKPSWRSRGKPAMVPCSHL